MTEEENQNIKNSQQAFPGESLMGREPGISKLEYFTLKIYCAILSSPEQFVDKSLCITAAKELLKSLSKETNTNDNSFASKYPPNTPQRL